MIKSYLNYTVGRKVLMALSGFFLMIFLLQHLAINLLSVISEELFNSVSHFMGTNILVQFLLQPILIFGFLFHLFMGIILEIKNRRSTDQQYFYNSNKSSSTWMSRNMIITGIMIFCFLGLHFYDFWVPEIKYKYLDQNPEIYNRYFHELQMKFTDIWRVIIYVISFCFLSLHLLHGFSSSFQSVGFRSNKFTPIIVKASYIYSILVPLGFIFIAIFHFLIQQ